MAYENGRELSRLLQMSRCLPELTDKQFEVSSHMWCAAGALVSRFGLTPAEYFNAFKRAELHILGGVCGANLAAEGWAIRLCHDVAELAKIDADSVLPAARIVQNDLDWAMTKIFENTGKLAVDADALPVLRTTIYRIENYIKLCLVPTDPEVLRQFGLEACQQLENNPEIEEEVFTGKYGFDLAALKSVRANFWSQITPKPKRTWYPS